MALKSLRLCSLHFLSYTITTVLLPTLRNNFSETTYKDDLQYQTLKDALTNKIKN